jgi:hypothetical protein
MKKQLSILAILLMMVLPMALAAPGDYADAPDKKVVPMHIDVSPVPSALQNMFGNLFKSPLSVGVYTTKMDTSQNFRTTDTVVVKADMTLLGTSQGRNDFVNCQHARVVVEHYLPGQEKPEVLTSEEFKVGQSGLFNSENQVIHVQLNIPAGVRGQHGIYAYAFCYDATGDCMPSVGNSMIGWESYASCFKGENVGLRPVTSNAQWPCRINNHPFYNFQGFFGSTYPPTEGGYCTKEWQQAHANDEIRFLNAVNSESERTQNKGQWTTIAQNPDGSWPVMGEEGDVLLTTTGAEYYCCDRDVCHTVLRSNEWKAEKVFDCVTSNQQCVAVQGTGMGQGAKCAQAQQIGGGAATGTGAVITVVTPSSNAPLNIQNGGTPNATTSSGTPPPVAGGTSWLVYAMLIAGVALLVYGIYTGKLGKKRRR